MSVDLADLIRPNRLSGRLTLYPYPGFDSGLWYYYCNPGTWRKLRF